MANRKTKNKNNKTNNGSALGFENKLWNMADRLRNNMDAAEYKHVVLGLIFLKYISDSFEEKHRQIKDIPYADPEDPDEYLAENIFWVPREARWSFIQAYAKKPNVGQLVDDAMVAIEKYNPNLKGVLPKNYARPALDKNSLGGIIDVVSSIELRNKKKQSEDKKNESEDEKKEPGDILGKVYEYFLGKFADAEGKRGGQFYTPQCVVKLLVEMLAPYKGRVYDPCCGSGGMFVHSKKFVQEHAGKKDNGNGGDISIYGQESNPTTWKLAKMNLAIRGIGANLGSHHADSFHNDLHPDLKADYILANPPFNMKEWGGERLKDDRRWKYGIPSANNANYAWIQHFIYHLAPTGTAGFVLANGSMSSNTSGEGDARKNIIEADLVDCMIALPGNLFFNTAIPACLWFLSRDKKNHRFRDRRKEVLFIDTRKMGTMKDRVHRELTDEDIKKIADTYHSWRGDIDVIAGEAKQSLKYEDIPGFCKSASLEEIAGHDYILTPGRYVGMEETEDDGEPFEEKMERLTTTLYRQFEESEKLEAEIKKNLSLLGFLGE